MNVKTENFLRGTIREGLEKLKPESVSFFNRIYGSVDTMPVDKLDTALDQVERSLLKQHLLKSNASNV